MSLAAIILASSGLLHPSRITPAASPRSDRPRCQPPLLLEMDDVDSRLLAADTTLLFAFAFARTLSTILISPDFPGWLAPVHADATRLSTTVGFAGSLALAWTCAGLVLGSFSTRLDDESTRRVGPQGAAATAAVAAALWVAVAAAVAALLPAEGGLPALRLSLENALGALGAGVGLVAWRWVYTDSSVWRL